MSARIDLTGKMFNTLEVKNFQYTKNTHAYWRVVCTVCDFEKTVSAANLNNGASANCNKCSKWSRSIEERRSIAADYLNGIKNNEIMEKFNITRSGIYKVLKDQGIKPDRKKMQ